MNEGEREGQRLLSPLYRRGNRLRQMKKAVSSLRWDKVKPHFLPPNWFFFSGNAEQFVPEKTSIGCVPHSASSATRDVQPAHGPFANGSVHLLDYGVCAWS